MNGNSTANVTNAEIVAGAAVVTIGDDDNPPVLAISDASVNENDGPATVTVTMTGVSAFVVSVDYATSDGTAMAGTDYTSVVGTLTWQPGETGPKTLTVPITNDVFDEPDETVSLSLLNVSATGVIGTGAAVLTILDDDIPPTGVADSIAVGMNRTISIAVLANDYGLSNSPVTVAIITPPAHGSATVAADNTVIYAPAANYTGSDSFMYRITDAVGQTSAATPVSILVTPAPEFQSPPTLTPDIVVASQPVQMQASVYVVNGAASIVWSFGDGLQGTGASVLHIYTTPGIYTITVTATSPEGLATTSQAQVFVGLALAGSDPTGTGGAALPPGVAGILVGAPGVGLEAGGTGRIVCNYVRRSRTTYAGSVGNIGFPAAWTQAQLAGQAGVLTLGRGPLAQSFVFTLDKRGRGKSTGLPKLEVNLAKKLFRFKANNRPELTDLTEQLGGTWLRGVKKGTPVMLLVPATLQIDSQVYLAMTFVVRYHQIGDAGKGDLAK